MEHVSQSEQTWAYDDDNGQQPLDDGWCDILNQNDKNGESSAVKFMFTRVMKSGAEHEYEVDITDGANMTSTNCKSKKKRALHRKEMRVLKVEDMLAAGSTAGFDVFEKHGENGGWKLQWQVEDELGWKNMTEDSNKALLTGIAAKKENVEITHHWEHPISKQRKTTIYDVHLSLGRQKSREWKGNSRTVRLVVLRMWCGN